MPLTGTPTPNLALPNFGPADRPMLDASPGLPDITAAIDALLGVMRRGTVFLSKSTTISLANNTLTGIPWDAEIVDPDNAHAPNSANIVVPFTGQYIVVVQGAMDTGAGDRLLRLDLNAVVFGYAAAAPPAGGSGSPWGMTLVRPYNATAGDVLTTYAYQNSGAALNLLGGLTSFLLWRYR